MRNMRKTNLLLLLLLCAALLTAGAALADGAAAVTFSDSGLEGETAGVRFEDGCLWITEPGEYILSGSLSDGQIRVDCEKEGRVTLYLNGVSVHCEHSAALLVGECEPKLVISLVAETENTFSNGASLVYTEDDEPNGVIFSDSDLTIEGGGALTVTAGAMDGIVSKDNLKIQGGEITVTAARHGIRGKDFVEISGGTLHVTAGKDGIKSTNKTDPDRGYVAITGGVIVIDCGDEPIQAENHCTIEDASVSFTVRK